MARQDVVIRFGADATQLQSDLSRIQRDVGQIGDGFRVAATRIASVTAAIAAVGFAARTMARASDQIREVALSVERLGGRGALGVAADLADRLGQSIQETGQQLAFFVPTFQKMGLAFGDAASFIETFNKSLRSFGVSGQQAARITTQLSQAFSSGELAGDELKSISENAAGLYTALEKQVQILLNSTDSLKELGSQGRVTSQVLYQAFARTFEDIGDIIKSLPDTLEQQDARLGNAWTRLLSGLDSSLKGSELYKFFATNLTGALESLAIRFGETSGPTTDISDRIKALSDQLAQDGAGRNRTPAARRTEIISEINDLTAELARRWKAALPAPAGSVGAAGAGGLTTAPTGSGSGSGATRAKMARSAEQIVRAAEEAAGLPPGALFAVWGVESSYGRNLRLTSSAGAVGPFQILPGTARGLGIDINRSSFEEQAKAAAQYLRQGMDAYGDLGSAFKFYHGGPDTSLWGPKTRAYEGKALGLRQQWLSASGLPDVSVIREQNEALEEGRRIWEATRTVAEAHVIQVDRLAELYKAGAFGEGAQAMDTYRRAVEQSAEGLTQLRTVAEETDGVASDLGLTFASAFEDAIVQARSLREVVQGLAQDVLRIFVRQTVTAPVGGFLADLFGGLFGGARAAGGPVTGGRPYLVGERGPELFVPSASGSIVPNGATMAPRVTINNAPGMDARTRDDGQGGIMIDIIRRVLADDVARGGVGWTRGLESAYGLGRGR